MQAILDDVVNEFKLPGAQAALRFADGRTLLAAAGTADIGHSGAAIDDRSIFRVGSTTKMFVAALALRLGEEGRLELGDTIDRWFPELPLAPMVTVRQLLNQTSGIPESLFADPLVLVRSGLSKHARWEARPLAVRMLKGLKLNPAARGRFAYSNNNYILLGIIEEAAGGKPLATQLREEFFDPIGMKDSYLLPLPGRPPVGLVPGLDYYMPLGPHLIPADTTSWDSLEFSAGALACSASDLAMWLDALFHGRVLSAAAMEQMRDYGDARDNGRDGSIQGYGLGLCRYEVGEWGMEGHPGAALGGECFPFYVRELDASIVISYNLSRKGNRAGKELLSRILAAARVLE